MNILPSVVSALNNCFYTLEGGLSKIWTKADLWTEQIVYTVILYDLFKASYFMKE